MKKRLFFALVGLFHLTFCQSLLADALPGSPLVLDKVSFSLSAKQWVETKRAKVVINVNALMTAKDLSTARTKIMEQLQSIATGDWRLTRFQRSQDNSGLEKLYVLAEARVDSRELSLVNQNAKKQSSPGISYKVSNIVFSPSFVEQEQAKEALRKKLYVKIQDELTLLNASFKGQHYTVNQIVFTTGNQQLPVQAAQKYSRNSSVMMLAETSGSSDFSVSNELRMNALVSLAATRSEKE